jgi:ubiquinone/menaquinone biosynthesis C-methylase UbiE
MKNKCCSICKKKFLRIIDLGNHPCADTFVKNQNLAIKLKKYPLHVGFCSCNHLTAINKISQSERYTKFDYSYTSDNSPVSRNHFYKIAKIIDKKFNLNIKNSIIEIGSNDGTFLKYIKKISNIKMLGVDPSKNMCKLAKKKGIKTYNNFFNLSNSKKIRKKYGFFDLLYAANVFNHIQDPNNFLKGCNHILKNEGIIILEVPDLDSLINTCGFDTIYHEHRQYFSINSMRNVLKKNNFTLLSFEKINYMSGSLRVFAKKNKNSKELKTKKIVNQKKYLNNFIKFQKKIILIKSEILKFISKYKKEGKIIIGIAAATKGNTLLNFCGIDYKDLKCIIESSPYKINKFTPGSAIPIVDEKTIKKYDAAIILPWNITKHLYKKFLHKSKIPYTSVQKIVKKIK